MGKLYHLKRRGLNPTPARTRGSEFKIFGEVSKLWGADLDKVLFDKDEKESKKLQRAVNKENLKHNSNNIKE